METNLPQVKSFSAQRVSAETALHELTHAINRWVRTTNARLLSTSLSFGEGTGGNVVAAVLVIYQQA